jgi:hypothetical protein
MCNSFFYEFRVILSANVLQLVCYTATTLYAHSWATETSSIGLYQTDPEYRNADTGLNQLTTERNASAGQKFSGIPAFTHDFSAS